MQVLMFHSYKGGSGKTIFSINVANTLVNKYNKRVLLIEADFTMPAFNNIFQDNKPDIYFNDYLNQKANDLSNYVYPDLTEKLGIIYCNDQFSSKDKVHGTDQKWFLTKIDQLRKDISKLDYDYVIFDLSPGFHFFTVSALLLSKVVVVTLRPDYHSFAATKNLLAKIYAKAVIPTKIKVYLAFNQIPEYKKMSQLVDEWIVELKNEFSFFDVIHKFKFHFETNYNAAIKKILLPRDDPLRLEIDQFLESIKLI